MSTIVLLRFLIPLLAVIIIVLGINRARKILRQDKREQVLEAKAEVEATLEAAQAAGTVTPEETQAVEDAKVKIADRVELGETAQ